MHAFGLGETIMIHARTPVTSGGELVRDDYGMVQYQEEIVTCRGAVIWPNSASEFDQSVERTVTTYVVVLPDGFFVEAVDRVVWRGLSYEVANEVEMYTNPMTGKRCNQFNMTRVEG